MICICHLLLSFWLLLKRLLCDWLFRHLRLLLLFSVSWCSALLWGGWLQESSEILLPLRRLCSSLKGNSIGSRGRVRKRMKGWSDTHVSMSARQKRLVLVQPGEQMECYGTHRQQSSQGFI